MEEFLPWFRAVPAAGVKVLEVYSIMHLLKEKCQHCCAPWQTDVRLTDTWPTQTLGLTLAWILGRTRRQTLVNVTY